MTALTSPLNASSAQRGETEHYGVRALIVASSCLVYLIGIAGSIAIDDHRSLLAPGITLMILGIFTFFYNGRKIIVSTSVISYSTVMFIGFPAVYAGRGHYWSYQVESPSSLLIVVTLGFLLQIATLAAAPGVPPLRTIPPAQETSTKLSKRWLILAIFMLVLALSSRAANIPLAPSAFAWAAVLFAAAVAFDIRTQRVRFSGIVVLALVTVGHMEIIYGGFGRLNLAVLGMSIAIIAAVGLRSWWVKISAVGVTAPALVYLANQRVNFLRDDLGRPAADSEGIGSVVGPLFSAGRLVEVFLDGRLDLAFGSTAITAGLAWVPRAIWPSKPDGLGREMVEITRPALFSTAEFSDAATYVGESVWNFGVWGAPLMLLAVVLAARSLDKALLHHSVCGEISANIVPFVLIVVLSASMLNVIWGGLFTAASRMFLPIAVLLAIWFLLNVHKSVTGARAKQACAHL